MNQNSMRCYSDQISDVETDGELLSRFYAGDRDALGELANRVSGQLLRRALRFLSERWPHRRHLAEDMVNEVFLRVIRTRDQMAARWASAKGSVMAWMTRILFNAIFSELR